MCQTEFKNIKIKELASSQKIVIFNNNKHVLIILKLWIFTKIVCVTKTRHWHEFMIYVRKLKILCCYENGTFLYALKMNICSSRHAQ